jgi:nucleoside-diphosphate-sugar epimerase
MNILVTGAGGFLGRYVVAALPSRGHHVRAVVRGASPQSSLPHTVEVCSCDLSRDNLTPILANIGAVIHLAGYSSAKNGLEDAVLGTERLCAAVAESGVTRFCHVSSLAVYDWSCADTILDENSLLAGSAAAPTDYAKSKLRQEQSVKRINKADLVATILRPGYIWGKSRLWVDGVGRRLPGSYLLVAPEAPLPLSYVENCADAVVRAALEGDGVFNIVDEPSISRREYLETYGERVHRRGLVIPVSYERGKAIFAGVGQLLNRLVETGKMPSLFNPERFESQFKPVIVSAEKIRREIGWTSPLGFAEATRRSFGIEPS